MHSFYLHMKAPAPLENLSSLLNIILVSSILMWSSIFTHSWYSLMTSLKMLVNYQELSNSTVTSPRQRLSSCLKWQSGWRSGTLHVLWHCWLQGLSAWSCFWGGGLFFNKQDTAPQQRACCCCCSQFSQGRILHMFTYHGPGQNWMNEQANGRNWDQLKRFGTEPNQATEILRNRICILECYCAGYWIFCFALSTQFHKSW